MPVDKKTIHNIVSILRAVSKTYKADTYIVGGAVRDILGLRQPKDVDVATSGDVKQIASVVSKRLVGSSVDQVAAPFELWRVQSNISTLDIVKITSDVDEDYKNRNFTVNALYYDVVNDKFMDPSDNGFKDLHDRVIRAVSDDCFSKRSDNIFIAMRLVAELNFKIEAHTLRQMVDAVDAMGTDMEISKRGQKEIQRAKLGMFYQNAANVSRYIGLGNFFSIYNPPAEATAAADDLRVVIAKYKSKKKTEKGNIIYEYGDKDKAKRAQKKARHVRTVFKNIKKLVSTFNKDLGSDDMRTRMSALAVALIYHTYERVGDRTNIGTGVTSLKKKHVTVSGNTVKFKYVGKSHVKQEKEVKDAKIAKLIKELLKDKSDNGYIFDFEGDEKVDVTAKDVNEYLKPFSITAKDLRGHAANELLIEKLKGAPKPPKGATEAERTKFFKEKLKEYIEEVAEEIGHTPGICKSSYIDPKLIESYEEGGKVTKLAEPKIMLFKKAIGDDDMLTAYLLRKNPNVAPESIGSEIEALKAKRDSSDVYLDPDLAKIPEVISAIEKLKSIHPDALKGILELMSSSKSKTSAPDAYGFVISDEPMIAYINADKVINDIKSGKDISEDLTNQIVSQIAGVVTHESEHSKGDEGEAGPTSKQEEITRRLMEIDGGADIRVVVAASSVEEDVFTALEIGISKDNAVTASKEVISRLKLGDGNRAIVNSALLAIGYLITHGENPYRAEWNVRKALGIQGNISFEAAKDLYAILNRNIIKAQDSETEEERKLSLFVDQVGESSDMGDSVYPKWEANPSTWPEEWKEFFPQRHPVNY
jgi:DNA topoisomerase-1